MGGDNSAYGIPFLAWCFIPLQPPSSYVSQPKAFVSSKVYDIVVTVINHVSGMAGWWEVNIRKQVGRAILMC
jgi:hypothetical protein